MFAQDLHTRARRRPGLMMVMRRVSPLLLVVALLRGATAAPLAVDSYRELTASDCGSCDVTPQPACGGNRNLSVAVLEACCDSTRGCGGFNTHGVIKDTACAAHVSHPANHRPVPQTSSTGAWTPAPPMPWPFPNDAQMSTGATTVQLSHDFAISAAAGPACPTLDAAVQRYQDQAVGLHVARPQEAMAEVLCCASSSCRSPTSTSRTRN